jgi:hypothetical protein
MQPTQSYPLGQHQGPTTAHSRPPARPIAWMRPWWPGSANWARQRAINGASPQLFLGGRGKKIDAGNTQF